VLQSLQQISRRCGGHPIKSASFAEARVPRRTFSFVTRDMSFFLPVQILPGDVLCKADPGPRPGQTRANGALAARTRSSPALGGNKLMKQVSPRQRGWSKTEGAIKPEEFPKPLVLSLPPFFRDR